MSDVYRLAVLTSHPIQYQAPLFRALAAHPEISLTVYFCSDHGVRGYDDPGFDSEVRWDVPLLEGYNHHFLANYPLTKRIGTTLNAFNPSVFSTLNTHNHDTVLVHGWNLATCWLAYASAALHHLPYLIRGESSGLSEPEGVRRAVKNALLRPLFARAAAFLAIGSYNQSFYRLYDADPSRVFLAPYSVDNEFFSRRAEALLPSRVGLRAKHGIPNNAMVVLFCGKLSPVKRPLDLLQAFASLNRIADCFLLYVGDGSLRGDIEREATRLGVEAVRITGFQNQTELPEWYALADLLVLPSDFEPWGLVINEAMNFGLPVIATDMVGAAPDLVHDGITGFTYPCGDVPELGKILQQLAERPDLRLKLGAGARRRIGEWGIPQTVDGYLAAISSLEAV